VRYDDYISNSLTLALDLATYATTGDLAELLDRQHDMLTGHGFAASPAALPTGEVEQLRASGARIATVLDSEPEEAFLDALAGLLDEQDVRPVLTRHDGTPHLHYTRPGASAPTWLAAVAVAGLVTHVCQHGRTRIRRCAASGCPRWYVDASRNRSRRYCGHACASRTTVRSYRSRQCGAVGSPYPRGEDAT
jgi:hypothetical protein